MDGSSEGAHVDIHSMSEDVLLLQAEKAALKKELESALLALEAEKRHSAAVEVEVSSLKQLLEEGAAPTGYSEIQQAEAEELRRQADDYRQQLQAQEAVVQALKEQLGAMETSVGSPAGKRGRPKNGSSMSSCGASPAAGAGIDAFSVPDFVWNCGNSDVLAYVQDLVEQNAALCRDQVFSRGGGASGSAAPSPSPPAIGLDSSMQQPTESIEEVVQELQACLAGGSAEACVRACRTAEALTLTESRNRGSFIAQGGVGILLKLVKRHLEVGNLEPLQGGIDVLWNLTFEEEGKAKVADGGGIPEVIAVMQKFPDSSEVQGSCCAVLINLAAQEGSRWKIARSGGVPAVVSAMERFATDELVLEQGCQALYMLAFHQELRPLVRAGEAERVTSLAIGQTIWGQLLQEVLAAS